MCEKLKKKVQNLEKGQKEWRNMEKAEVCGKRTKR